MTDSADLLETVRRLLADSGLYQPDSATSGLVLTAAGEAVMLTWSATAPVPAARTAVAIRTALLELLAAGGLSAVYRRAPGQSSGTITVTDPRAARPEAVLRAAG